MQKLFLPRAGVIVVAATNFPESLDKALIRPGRFDWHVTVPNPDVRGRVQILEVHFRDVPRQDDVDLEVCGNFAPPTMYIPAGTAPFVRLQASILDAEHFSSFAPTTGTLLVDAAFTSGGYFPPQALGRASTSNLLRLRCFQILRF